MPQSELVKQDLLEMDPRNEMGARKADAEGDHVGPECVWQFVPL